MQLLLLVFLLLLRVDVVVIDAAVTVFVIVVIAALEIDTNYVCEGVVDRSKLNGKSSESPSMTFSKADISKN